MSYTFTEHTTDGVQVTFPFQFAGKDKAYLRATDVVVYLLLSGVWTEVTNWSLSGTNQITFLTPPAASTVVNMRIRRIVPKVDPYAEFARGVTLDMRSLNYSFIQNLQVSQELMDGFFPTGFFYKEDLNMGFNHIINLAPGVNPNDAVNFKQLDDIDKKHTTWNQQQDLILDGLLASAGAGTAHRTVPWVYTAVGGETEVIPPYTFTAALVYINGVLQYELKGAITITNNKIVFAEPLVAGWEVLTLIGSRTAAPDDGAGEINRTIAEGQTIVPLGVEVAAITVYLDGLKQPGDAYTISGTNLTFTEALPACKFSALAVIPAGGNI